MQKRIPYSPVVLFLFLFSSLTRVHAQSSEDFKGKWAGYIKVDGVPRYRLFLEFSNPQARQVTGKLNLYDYVKTDQLAKTLTANFDYDKQKRIAYTNTTIPAPSGSQCEGYIILKISASSADSLEATFRTSKDCMKPQVIISRSNSFLLYDPVFSSQKIQPGAAPDGVTRDADAHTVTQPANAVAPVLPAADAPVIDPKAVYIEGTSLEPFINGTALVRNNRTSGIIDAGGKFVLGYGKLGLSIIASMDGARPANMLYHSASITTSYVTTDYLYDNRGKLITSFSLPKVDISLQQDGNSLYANCAYNYHTIYGIIVKDFVCINEKGQKFNFKSLYQDPIWSEGVNVVRTQDKLEKRSYGYVNLQGQTVIPLKYKDAFPFSEGLAAVAKEDMAGGTYKYGFIDHMGNEVIPFVYSNPPGNFHHGLAKVIPKTKDEFELGFINKKGELVLKITKGMLHGSIFDKDDFQDGYLVCTDGLIDTNGRVYNREDICRMAGLDPSYASSLDVMHFAKGEIFYGTGRGPKGLVDIEGKFTIPCIYSELSYFDPVSHLAHARWEKYDAATQKKKVIDGYINQRGVFVIVMGEGSKW